MFHGTAVYMASLATSTSLSSTPLKTLYTRLLLTRLIDERLQLLREQGYLDVYTSCRGYEAAQVGSATCIEVGRDFTLPSYRDLGVVLTIGMTPYEVMHICLCTSVPAETRGESSIQKQPLQWGYHKRNMVHGNTSTATHILHAAGIAFASKLRKAAAVTVAYCGDSETTEPDFLEGIRFAAQHQLPVIFICEHTCSASNHTVPSCFKELPEGLTHQQRDGADVVQIYETMKDIIEQVRIGSGPILLEIAIVHPCTEPAYDPLLRCEYILREQGLWDEQWAASLVTRLNDEIEQAVHNVLLDDESSGQ